MGLNEAQLPKPETPEDAGWKASLNKPSPEQSRERWLVDVEAQTRQLLGGTSISRALRYADIDDPKGAFDATKLMAERDRDRDMVEMATRLERGTAKIIEQRRQAVGGIGSIPMAMAPMKDVNIFVDGTGKPIEVPAGRDNANVRRAYQEAKAIDELLRNPEDQRRIRELPGDPGDAKSPPVDSKKSGISKGNLDTLDRYAYLREGLQFLSDHFDRLDKLDQRVDKNISRQQILDMAQHGVLDDGVRQPLRPDVRAGLTKLADRLTAEHVDQMTLADVTKHLKDLPQLPDLSRYDPFNKPLRSVYIDFDEVDSWERSRK